MVCIAVGPHADEKLELLSKKTNGCTYFVDDCDLFTGCVEPSVDVPTDDVVVNVCQETVLVGRGSLFTRSIMIDSEIGRNVIFQVLSKNYHELSCDLTSPFDSLVTFARDDWLKRFVFKNNTVEPGNWTLVIRNNSKRDIKASILVKCGAMDENPIRMKVTLIEPDVYNPSPPIIVAELMKGTDIVIGAEVIATVDCPDGTQKKLSLKNHKDTIYCSHFTDYRGAGRYNVTVFATNTDEDNVIINPYNKQPGKNT